MLFQESYVNTLHFSFQQIGHHKWVFSYQGIQNVEQKFQTHKIEVQKLILINFFK